MSVRIGMVNEKEVLSSIDRVMPRVETELTTALDDGLVSALHHSERRVPERTGDLKSTGRVTKTEKVGGTILRAEIGYGGKAASGRQVNYAIEQHESVHSSGRKYLQTAMERADLPGRLDKAMAKALGL